MFHCIDTVCLRRNKSDKLEKFTICTFTSSLVIFRNGSHSTHSAGRRRAKFSTAKKKMKEIELFGILGVRVVIHANAGKKPPQSPDSFFFPTLRGTALSEIQR